MNDAPGERIKKALARVLSSDEFRSTQTRSRFLQYIVEETLEGRADGIKGYSIGVDVYGRDADFDPQTDPVVRLEASRLRRDLEHYYLTDGSEDEIRISIPKGRYVPVFDLHEPDPATPAESDQIPTQTVVAETAVPARRSRWPVTTGIAAVLIIVVVAGWAGIFGTDFSPAPQTSSSVVGPTVYVIPFEAVSENTGEASLAKGLSIEIVNVLSQFVELMVFPVRPDFEPPKPQAGGTSSTAPKLQFVLRGNVQLSGDKVRITTSLLNADNGLQVWSERYDSEFSTEQIFEVQEKIATNVAGQLAEPFGLLRKFSRRQMKDQGDPSLVSYRCVLTAYEYRQVFTPQMHATAKACLERAVKTDPDYSRAWALLAHIYVDEYRLLLDWQSGARERAIAAARRAVELNPEDVLSYQALSLALFSSGDIEEALDAARKAASLNPHNKEALLQLGMRTAFSGEWEEGVAIAQQAIRESPAAPGWYHWVPALYHYKNKDYEKAKAEIEKFDLSGLLLNEAVRTMVYGQMGLQQKAAERLANCRRLYPNFDRDARRLFAVHQFSDSMLTHMMEGLYKAGVKRDSAQEG